MPVSSVPPRVASLRDALVNIVWPRRRHIALGLALIVVNRASGLALPAGTKLLIDGAVEGGSWRHDKLLLAGLVLAVALQAGTRFALTRVLSVEAQRLIADLRKRLQRHVLSLPPSFFDHHTAGALTSRIMSDVEGVRNLVGTGLVLMVGGAITALGAFVLLMFIQPWMTLLTLVPMALFAWVSTKAFRHIRPIYRRRSDLLAQVTSRLTEALGGIRVLKGFDAEALEIRRFEEGVERLFENVAESLTATSLVTSAATLLLGLTSVLVLGVGANAIAQGAMTVGDFIAFSLYLGFLVTPIVQMSGIGTQLTEALAGLDRMEELLRLPREDDDPSRRHRLTEVRGDIEFDRVSFSYDGTVPALREVSFRMPPGSVTALVGTSGSGKSTIAALAASFLTPTAGMVRVDGVDLATVDLHSYRRHLGVVLQETFLFDGTLRDNILLARPGASEQEVEEAVAAAHVEEFADRLPRGLETLIGERGVRLSGGQRQRVAIARALLARPRILLLDEATSSLDSESERLIQDSLERLLEGRTTLVVAHRLSTIRRADQILVVEDGGIADVGTHEELMARGGRYRELYTLQARI